ncbi:CubicO group peptidase, beta-lactamase class C family [Nonomuraea solani]|uniref:CubicO group peptidase, beta-lactamase class C family n=1 Tax=Nonomuraea solani TaxID=1144553 RepID=A0A1H6EVZ9_9ACTN|nr:serine hydrolase domain-containing protein [Nonomuraea solani]SEH01593.1 CubicO group peptidase, beta-lactamase class C family [Nonomuraea solani]
MYVGHLAAALDAYVPEIIDHCGTPGLSVAIGVGEEVALARAYGLADLATGRPMTVDTVGPTGSDCKPYTGVAAMQLVERGLIGLDDPIDDIVNPHGERPITLRDLLTHHSGLGTGLGNWDRVPPAPLGEHLRRVFAAGRSDAYGGALLPFWAGKVGERYQYSNLGIAVAGHLVERLNPDGVTFSEWVRRYVFAPLGMDSTCFPPAQHPDHVPAELLARRSTGYATLPGYHFPLPDLYPGDYPAGSALSTPSDHARFILALLNGGGAVLEPATAEQMITTQASGGTLMGPSPDISVGLVFNVFGGEHPHIGHGGEYPWGWNHFTRGWPGPRVALVISANQYDLGDFGLSDRPSHQAARLVAEIVTAWVQGADPRPRRDLAAARGHLAGLLVGDRLTTRFGIASQPSDEEVAELANATVVAPGISWDPEAFRQAVGQVRLTDWPQAAALLHRELPGYELALLKRQLGVPGFGTMTPPPAQAPTEAPVNVAGRAKTDTPADLPMNAREGAPVQEPTDALADASVQVPGQAPTDTSADTPTNTSADTRGQAS